MAINVLTITKLIKTILSFIKMYRDYLGGKPPQTPPIIRCLSHYFVIHYISIGIVLCFFWKTKEIKVKTKKGPFGQKESSEKGVQKKQYSRLIILLKSKNRVF